MDYWGFHLMLDCSNCDKSAITDEAHIKNFIKTLVKDIDMVAYGEPMVAHFATHDPGKAGFSFCQMIETSNISGHMVDSNGDFYLDVFSCKPFSNEAVQNLVNRFFNPRKIRVNYITRCAS